MNEEKAKLLYDPNKIEYCASGSGEGSYQCRWCPCRFSTVPDLEAHYEAFGRDERTHKERWHNRSFLFGTHENDDSEQM